MAHDILSAPGSRCGEHGHSVREETGRATMLIVAILVGGMLVILSWIAELVFESGSGGRNFHSDVLGLMGAILLGMPIVIHSIKELVRGHTHMDELVAIAVVAAIASLDYKAAGAVSFFLLIGNLIESRTALGARASIEELLRLAPKKAVRLTGGREEEVEPADLSPGDVVRVRPGENIPADGEIIAGKSAVNQANVTGESLPVDKSVGDEVFSGTNNENGGLDIRVTRVGEDTTLGRVRKLILRAEATRHPIMRLVDRYAGFYTPAVLMIAAVVLYFSRDASRAVSILVVSCPCPIILAVPTAMVAALSCAARLGILIKDVSMLELAKEVTAFVFDKTGTLTTGRLTVGGMMPAPGVDGKELLSAAGSAELMSRHPVARAVVDVARKARVDLKEPALFEETPGLGVSAVSGGVEIRVGRRQWLAESGVDFSAMSGEQHAEPEGMSTLYVVADGVLLGRLDLEDRTRGEARDSIGALRESGIRELVMITGDRWPVARRVAAEMGCNEVQAEALPDDKLALVDAMKRDGHTVAVVGDGVNDAPALAAGNLSIAMGVAGSDVAINSADIALMNNDLQRLPFLRKLSMRTGAVVHQNLVFGAIGIVVLMVLAGLGMIPPFAAAVFHTVGATFVIFNSARLVRIGEELDMKDAAGETQSRPGPKVERVPATA